MDWGSSSFRAYLFDDDAAVIDDVELPLGIREVNSGESDSFEHVFFEAIGQWLTVGDTVLLSGMISSRNGWHETSYLQCPANISAIASHVVIVNVRGIRLVFLPGISQRKPGPDVMRGEELQLLGASLNDNTCTVVLPGTHSKWARVTGAVLQQFHTLMTGELFELLMKHSLIGQLAGSDEYDDQSFAEGVKRGVVTPTLVSDIFALRSSVLLGQTQSSGLQSQLSGMLIGNEIREGLTLVPDLKTKPVILVGNEKLCSLYETAFAAVGIRVEKAHKSAAINGFQKIAHMLSAL